MLEPRFIRMKVRLRGIILYFLQDRGYGWFLPDRKDVRAVIAKERNGREQVFVHSSDIVNRQVVPENLDGQIHFIPKGIKAEATIVRVRTEEHHNELRAIDVYLYP